MREREIGEYADMASATEESPIKAYKLSKLLRRMTLGYRKKATRASEDSILRTDEEASSRGLRLACTPRSTDINTDHLNSSKSPETIPSLSSSLFRGSPPTTFPDPSLLAVKVQVLETLVSKLFSTISSLRSSYLHLRSAYLPCNSAQLDAADEAVFSDIRKLCDLKHAYIQRDSILSAKAVDAIDVPQHPSTDMLLKSYEGLINNFRLEIRKKNAEAEGLKNMLAESTLQREKLEKKVKRLEERVALTEVSLLIDRSPSSLDNGTTIKLLVQSVQDASVVSKSFTKLLISLMKAARWDFEAASDSIEVGINYAKLSHRKHAFESYVCQQMWNGFENEDFYTFGTLSSILDPDSHRRACLDEYMDFKGMDPMKLLSAKPDCLFGKFCQKKFLQLVHPKMEASFFGNFEHRNQISEGRHPNSKFYQNFLIVAKAVWLVHRLAFSFFPSANIFQARRGSIFSPICMDSVVPGMEEQVNHVGFTVMPGFRKDREVIKCVVYLASNF